MQLPDKINDVVEAFSHLPGLGPKSALRHALYLAKWDTKRLDEFSGAIKNLASLQACTECGLYCDQNICHICSNEHRGESKVLCVVESISDCLAIEKSETFQGRYHILGGVLNPLMGIGPDELGIKKLLDRCEQEQIKTIILAISSSVEGDATSAYLRQLLSEDISVERIGFGIPMGGSLEYLDALTITKALENRKRMD